MRWSESLDALYSPRALTLDEIWDALRPPPLKPINYGQGETSNELPGSSLPEIAPDSGPMRNRASPWPLSAPTPIPPDSFLDQIIARQAAQLSPLRVAATANRPRAGNGAVLERFDATLSKGVADVRRRDLIATPGNIRGTSLDPIRPYFPHWTRKPPQGQVGEWISDEPYIWIDEDAAILQAIPPGTPIRDMNSSGQPGHFLRQPSQPSTWRNQWGYRLSPWWGM